eukprot:TRINITY_DN5488_c1_g1_i5.p1 TRINITY_DN5488_c1_g1~~TRINITY_DN5488_c1_g1_i5.p1  ORF type:complete len:113 (-),score=6.68 TRINITY_DN5488_c1_g1_i5:750-1088(-)
MLKLCRQTLIFCDDCPVICPHDGINATNCEHWFNRESLAQQHAAAIIVSVMKNNWISMKNLSHPMANKLSNYTIAKLICMITLLHFLFRSFCGIKNSLSSQSCTFSSAERNF